MRPTQKGLNSSLATIVENQAIFAVIVYVGSAYPAANISGAE